MTELQSGARPQSKTRRRVIGGLVGSLLCLLAACADAGDDPTSPEASGDNQAFPVTIESRWGSQTIESAPARVVTLDNQATDAALALGVVPVGIPLVTFVPGDEQVWTAAALQGKEEPEKIEIGEAVPFEAIAALEPDLILATNSHQLDEEQVYRTLAGIAPTVHFTDHSLGDTWQETTLRIGRALGEEKAASELVDQVELKLAEVVRRTPQFEGRTVNLFNADPSGLYAISSPDDYSMKFLGLLGLKISPAIDALQDEFPGRAPVSEERYDVLDADLVVGTSVSPETLTALASHPIFSKTAAFQDGRYLELEIGPATSMAFPSVLSISWALDNVIPRMETAIKKL